MTVCIVIVSAGLFHFVPPEDVKKTVVYAARDLMTPGGDIVIVYPSLSDWSGLERFKLSDEGETYNVVYTWSYDTQSYSQSVEIPREMFEYYQNKSHDRRDYAQYAVSEYDRDVVLKLAESFRAHGQKYRYSEDEIALNIISFVHTIPYTYDSETKGVLEYPRYPAETLVEGGDCEDRAILAAAILYELDIDCILIHMKDHMALGLKDNGNFTGQSYVYNGTVYYYAGVTDGETTVGIISEDINPELIAIFPVVQSPVLSAKINQYMIGFDDDSYKYVLQGTVQNAGAGHGQNVSIRVVTEITNSADTVPDQLISIASIPEDYSADIEVTIKVPRANGIITIFIEGENFEPIEVGGFYFNLGNR
ncbi:hypothetical protein MmiHf6_07210 [Methanimicrococcus hongohii]|uniref:Transglutaminase-like domain-containing protein n=2 Tax=Methanimicrococcus hongohii TaxID=3028295 RepID=A0AA96UZC8_9EURY|nr:hypothetical protein MmiHf6_07210 [Methanimicrococcus sp. Hf6]